MLFENNHIENGDDCITVGNGAKDIHFRCGTNFFRRHQLFSVQADTNLLRSTGIAIVRADTDYPLDHQGMVVRLPMSRTSCKCWSLWLSWICSLCQLQRIENVVMVNRYTCNLLPWLVNISCRIIPCMEPVLRVGPEGTGWHESKGMTIYGFASAERSQYNMEGYNLHQCPISSTSRSCASLCCL